METVPPWIEALRLSDLARCRRRCQHRPNLGKDRADTGCNPWHNSAAATATNPAMRAYSIRSWPAVSFQS
jgi:hypothetical protein